MPFSIYRHSAIPPRLKERAGVWAAVITGHALVGAALCWQLSPPPRPPVGNDGQMVTVALVAAMAEAGPVADNEPVPIKTKASQPPPTDPVDDVGLEPVTAEAMLSQESSLTDAEMELVSAFQPSAMGEPGAACDVTQQLAQAFGASPEVRQGIAAIPANGRSVANAVMLWDGHWAEGTQAGGMAVLRALLVKAVVSSRPECLQAQNQGPVLFLIPDNQTTVVLAIGSGQWRWADVLAPSSPTDVVAGLF
ncbi:MULTISPECIES: hypothetical protein [Asticcacaulis]|uniref:hypothetical protein n=1 Tax=Asticcacaulis TaxID=76890 RepID=UPI001AE24D26|nr:MULTISPECIES: hypothetical protein [Asticcacaulis]MBP2157468.1 hypothetical protein [Asticcacaulis solisilvae]MDR6798513.1 hypothetical protein [Asticcacaulis sp. BE141]